MTIMTNASRVRFKDEPWVVSLLPATNCLMVQSTVDWWIKAGTSSNPNSRQTYSGVCLAGRLRSYIKTLLNLSTPFRVYGEFVGIAYLNTTYAIINPEWSLHMTNSKLLFILCSKMSIAF